MSNVAPFEGSAAVEVISVNGLQTPSLFEPDLEGFDWVSYEDRQVQLDAVRSNNGTYGSRTGDLLRDFHENDDELGVKLANLDNREIGGIIPRGLNASFAILTLSNISTDMLDANFQKSVFTETDFGSKDFTGADFTDAVMVGAKFAGARLNGASFVNVVLNGADFTNAELRGVDFTGAYLQDVKGLTPEQVRTATLTGARMMLRPEGDATLDQLLSSRFGAIGSIDDIRKKLDAMPVSIDQVPGILQSNKLLRGVVVQGGMWNGVSLVGSDLTGATIDGLLANKSLLRGATMSGSRITNATLKEADMVGAWAPGVVMEGVALTDANLKGANLCGAIFRAVDLRGVTGLDPKGSNLNGIFIDDSSRLPQGYGFDGNSLQVTAKVQRELEK